MEQMPLPLVNQEKEKAFHELSFGAQLGTLARRRSASLFEALKVYKAEKKREAQEKIDLDIVS
jgi:hypothetical protein